MRSIKLYINESLVTSKPTGEFKKFKYHPQSKEELMENIRTELKAGNVNLNCIDTSAIDDMSKLFAYYDGVNISHYPNIDLSEWDVSHVRNMYAMFSDCTNYRGIGLENWDVSNVKNTSCMFARCDKFNCDISNWDVSNVINMENMFYGCYDINCDLTKWTVSKVNYVNGMFKSSILRPVFDETPIIKNGKFVKIC